MSVLMRDIGLLFSFIVTALSGVGITIVLGSWNELTGVLAASLFRKRLCRTDLVECLITFASKASWSFLCWEVDPAPQVSGTESVLPMSAFLSVLQVESFTQTHLRVLWFVCDLHSTMESSC